MGGILKYLRPHSLLTLVLFGFGLAILPLIVAMIFVVFSIDELAVFSQKTVHQAVRITQGSRSLVDSLTAMERSAGQFQILDDPVFMQVYDEEHNAFVETVDTLFESIGDPPLRQRLGHLAANEKELHRGLTNAESGTGTALQSQDAFPELNALAQEIWQRSGILVGLKIQRLEKISKSVQKRTLVQMLILFPISMLLVLVFVFLIVRPIKQLDTAIRVLGRGDFHNIIKVVGPKDLEFLGDRLEWLRIRLNALEEEKQRFLRNVSHELKTPLTAIREGVDLMAEQVVGELNQEQAEITRILRQSSGKLDKLIENLINYSQIQFQQSELNAEQLDFGALIESVIEEHQIGFRAKELRADVRLGRVNLVADAAKMRTVVDNLLSNAVKYSPQGGAIVVTLRRIGGEVQLDIEDQGPGIDADERARIFDAFVQGRAAKETGIRGTGLGLAIVRECVAAHRGSVKVLDVTGRHGGALFRVVVPEDFRSLEQEHVHS